MNHEPRSVVSAHMSVKARKPWPEKNRKKNNMAIQQLLRRIPLFGAVVFLLGIAMWSSFVDPGESQVVMSHVTADFEYDETLGRLQFVSNILPESAMVFLSSDSGIAQEDIVAPTSADVVHTWTQREPWFEYACMGDVAACLSGEVMSVLQNRAGSYTVRILHDGGYESIYSGLNTVDVSESEEVVAGGSVGEAEGFVAFEVRKDGVSILPVFGDN